jgi:hypothetical protein
MIASADVEIPVAVLISASEIPFARAAWLWVPADNALNALNPRYCSNNPARVPKDTIVESTVMCFSNIGI